MPATTLATTPKMMTPVALKPNVIAAMDPAKVKMPARPSRYTALATRNQNVSRAPR
jgi:hypothetical protein